MRFLGIDALTGVQLQREFEESLWALLKTGRVTIALEANASPALRP